VKKLRPADAKQVIFLKLEEVGFRVPDTTKGRGPVEVADRTGKQRQMLVRTWEMSEERSDSVKGRRGDHVAGGEQVSKRGWLPPWPGGCQSGIQMRGCHRRTLKEILEANGYPQEVKDDLYEARMNEAMIKQYGRTPGWPVCESDGLEEWDHLAEYTAATLLPTTR
jgi:hypothetical protein